MKCVNFSAFWVNWRHLYESPISPGFATVSYGCCVALLWSIVVGCCNSRNSAVGITGPRCAWLVRRQLFIIWKLTDTVTPAQH